MNSPKLDLSQPFTATMGPTVTSQRQRVEPKQAEAPTAQPQSPPKPAQVVPVDQLEKRLARMFSQLEGRMREELDQMALEQRKALKSQQDAISGRLLTLEHEVNALEGHMRIDMLREQSGVVEAALDARGLTGRVGRLGRLAGLAGVLLLGVTLGVLFAADLYFYGVKILGALGIG